MNHVIHHEIGLSMLLQLAHRSDHLQFFTIAANMCKYKSTYFFNHHPHSWREGNPHFSSSSWIWKVHVSLQQQVYLYYHISHSRLKTIAWLASAIHVQRKLIMYNRPGCVGEAQGWSPSGKQASAGYFGKTSTLGNRLYCPNPRWAWPGVSKKPRE
jgi:hypothetical protein